MDNHYVYSILQALEQMMRSEMDKRMLTAKVNLKWKHTMFKMLNWQ